MRRSLPDWIHAHPLGLTDTTTWIRRAKTFYGSSRRYSSIADTARQINITADQEVRHHKWFADLVIWTLLTVNPPLYFLEITRLCDPIVRVRSARTAQS